MSDFDPTFVFEGGKAYAISEGKVIASANDVEELEEKLTESQAESVKREATHIVTPNGLKGQILGRTPDLWGEEVTIRLENGRVAHLHVSDDIQFVTEEEAQAESPLVALERQIEQDYQPDRESLQKRQETLKAIKQQARTLITKGASLADSSRLDDLIVTADNEIDEIKQVIRAMDAEDAERFEAPAPFNPQVVEQESLGGGRGEWLDRTLGDMIDEAESVDYEKLMDEGPEVFVSELDTTALADGGVVRQMASSFIRGKTAAAHESIREKYEQTWLTRVEECRRQELTERKSNLEKEAAQERDEHSNLPDDMLFF